MGWLSQRLGLDKPQPIPDNTVLLADEDCTELVAAVGEASYQVALRRICQSDRWEEQHYDCIATLIPEPTNPHDPHAVMVQVSGQCVGYLSRGDAQDYAPLIARAMPRFIACSARIAGRGPGSDTPNVGIFLKLPPSDTPLSA